MINTLNHFAVHTMAFIGLGMLLGCSPQGASAEFVCHFKAHEDSIYPAYYCPKTKRLLTAGKDHVVRMWDIESGKLLKEVKEKMPVSALCIIPSGEKIVTANQDAVLIWDTPQKRKGMLVNPIFERDTEENIQAVYLSNSGQSLYAIQDRTIAEFTVQTGEQESVTQLSSFGGSTDYNILQTQYFKGQLALITNKGYIDIFDVKSVNGLQERNNYISSVKLYPDRLFGTFFIGIDRYDFFIDKSLSHVICYMEEMGIKVLNLRSNRSTVIPSSIPDSKVSTVSFNADYMLAAIAGDNGEIELHQKRDGKYVLLTRLNIWDANPKATEKFHNSPSYVWIVGSGKSEVKVLVLAHNSVYFWRVHLPSLSLSPFQTGTGK